MTFSIEHAIALLQRTPFVLDTLLRGLPKEWVLSNEGADTWSALDVIAHLIYCDKENWPVRAKHILTYQDAEPFPPFDRMGGFEIIRDRPVAELLDEFKHTRKAILQEVETYPLTESNFSLSGLHPQFGQVKLSQLLSAWVVHDLSHLSQVSRVLAKQYREEVGPWIAFLKILH
jgi:hypothetical protein